MNTDALPQLRRLIREELASLRLAELAVVQEQHAHADEGDTNNYSVTLRLRDTGLVLAEVPVATTRLGVAAIPPVGALVLVQFIGGDINAPVVTGSLYNDEDRPPVHTRGQFVLNLPHDADTDDAVHIELNSDDSKRVELKLGKSVTLTLSEEDPTVHIDVGGNARISIDGDGQVKIQTAQNISIESDADLKFKAGGNMELQAGGQMTIKGSVINLN